MTLQQIGIEDEFSGNYEICCRISMVEGTGKGDPNWSSGSGPGASRRLPELLMSPDGQNKKGADPAADHR